MSTSLTVRDIDPADKSWGVSMEDFVRCLIHEKRENTERRSKPSKAFARLFGERYGVELPAPPRCGYRPLSLSREDRE